MDEQGGVYHALAGTWGGEGLVGFFEVWGIGIGSDRYTDALYHVPCFLELGGSLLWLMCSMHKEGWENDSVVGLG